MSPAEPKKAHPNHPVGEPGGGPGAGHAGGGVALLIGAVGVVFGDLGTSPLYALQECFSGPHGMPASRENVLGIVSLVLWSLTLVVTVKYLAFLMQADNKGEGGILALLALVPERLRTAAPGKVAPLALLVVAGAALLFGDGVITPAISVLSAVEGLEVATASAKPFVIPITVAILTVLALGELITDQLPKTPSRTVPMQFIARLITGGFAGAALGTAWGYRWGGLGAALIGAAVGTIVGYELRRRLSDHHGIDLPVAITEDVVAVVGGLAVVALTAAL